MKTPILWINLDRRKDRAAWFVDNNIRLFPELNWIRVSGFDHWWHSFAQTEAKGTSHGHAGCWLSHKAALQIGLATGVDRFIVLEDDALVGSNFIDALSFPFEGAVRISGLPGGTYAISYSADSARRCLAELEIRRENVDRQLDRAGMFTVSSKPYVSHFGGFDSDTETKPVDERDNHGKDHSQHGEQGAILSFFGSKIGRFIDIGAYDGVEGSNSRGLSDRSWSGVCVEANPFTFQRLVQNHSGNPNIECLNAAVSPISRITKFWDTGGQVSTALRDHSVSQWVQRVYNVACVTPDDIVKSFGNAFDFMSLDVEGLDLEVLKYSARLIEKCSLICVEHSVPCKGFSADYYAEMMGILALHGFKKVVGLYGDGGLKTDPSAASNTLIAKS